MMKTLVVEGVTPNGKLLSTKLNSTVLDKVRKTRSTLYTQSGEFRLVEKMRNASQGGSSKPQSSQPA